MLNKLVKKVLGTSHEREMRKLQPMVDRINSFEPKISALSTPQLQAKTAEFRERLSRGEHLDAIMPEAFACVREAGKRVLGMRHYDVQMIGGMVLNRGGIAEMRTGEGKTLVATLPMYLNALSGKGAHLVTVNDYLAKRDCEWMGQLYKFMGLTTGTIVHEKTDRERQEAYGADITYGTNNEFGFDYLRDNMKFALEDYVQRPHHFAIVDECDSILIDEARTPLIISGPSEDSTELYYTINKIVPHLKLDVHFTMEEKSRSVSLTEEGNAKVEELLGIGNLYDPEHLEMAHFIYQGLKAHHLYKKDVEYMIVDGEVVIVDEFTGRLMQGRRWSDGLHQAVEAKEGVEVRSENQTLATITFQNFFRMYEKLSGMTGTAETEAVEFKKIYNLDVSVIPTNKPISRIDAEDIVFKNEAAKFRAIVRDIKERKEKNQPVLVGTVSIERSERISRALKNEGITHNVLNAKHHEREAEIVAQAGSKGAITIATNMAGRGTDIVLGGNPESRAKIETGEAEGERYEQALAKHKAECAKEKLEVLAAGGLYIIGTERHESRRIDNQLRGRAGRQGDPGESRFYLSLEDDLMRKFNGERISKIMELLKVPEDEPIMAKMVSNAIEGAQRKVEGHNFDIRKHLLEYDDVMNKQRSAVYKMRRSVLGGDGIDRIILDMLGEVTSNVLDQFVPEGEKNAKWDITGLQVALGQQFGITLDSSKLTPDQITDHVGEKVKAAYDRQKEEIGELWERVQKMVLLQTIDARWKDHLQIIDHLKEGINLRAYAQKDPLVEYKKEGFRAFEQMNNLISAEVIEKILKIRIVSQENTEEVMREQQERRRQQQLKYQGSEASAAVSALQSQASSPMSSGQGQSPESFPPGFPSRGALRDDGPKMNRAQRRRLEKKKN
ncbi:MAG: preprotein translocase subunit SecA [Bdellovibrionales bacterium]|nr:preprotein translocase subunit SecA [Bdellovibrionales bacterium]